ncbi:tyrosine-type recombinase/integrase [Ramlibacter sp. AN1133]|uniref:tyrosine-type recombinase/integrase n=1 Tax=Ramlibacter sp. AN1133 TaxID=3133429 RepID=UPI0030C03553
MAVKIHTVSAREALKPRHNPYWHRVRKGAYIGFRKTSAATGGSWLARFRDEETGKQQLQSLGRFDKLPPSDRFDAALREAEAWFRHRDTGGTSELITVAGACREYVKHLQDRGREAAATDAARRFKRWIYGNEKFAGTRLLKLTPKAVADWRTELAKTPAIPQDKSKPGTRLRSASTLNRDMTALRAALNLARENGHVTTDQAWLAKLRPVENADGRRDVYLDIEQRRKLIDAARADVSALLRALSMVPLRPGAMAALRVGDFDKRLSTITIGKDKAGADRKITLPKSTAAFFEALCRDKLPATPLLTRADGKAWDKDAWKGPIKDAVKAAGLPHAATAYALRHSAITDLIALHKLDTLTVAQLSGTSLQMIERHYGHLLREHAASALARLAL